MTRTCAAVTGALLVACGTSQEPLQDADVSRGQEAPTALRQAPGCAPGTLWSSETAGCAPVRGAASDVPGADADAPPRLSEMRRAAHDQPRRGTGRAPVPGGLGSGTTYQPGKLRVTTGSSLYTHMIVYPNGIATSRSRVYDGFTFTSGTNRTEKSLEIVGIYYGSGPAATSALGVFDWSCSPADPCRTSGGSQTQPSWVWNKQLSKLTCYYRSADDGGGHRHNQLYYVNAAEIADATSSPPLWTNQAYLWNYCKSAWDTVYSHPFRVEQQDCSVDNSCSWWGPIIETFIPDPQPPLKELGYVDSLLLHDGTWSYLGTGETSWSAPVPNLLLFHLDPNRSWGVGNVTYN